MSHTPSKIEFFSGRQPVKAELECPEYLDEKSRSIEYYFSEEELDESLPPRLWIGSGEDGNLYSDYTKKDSSPGYTVDEIRKRITYNLGIYGMKEST